VWCKESRRRKGAQLEGKELWLNLKGNSSEEQIYRANLKANCQKERNCGSVRQVNSSEKKQTQHDLQLNSFEEQNMSERNEKWRSSREHLLQHTYLNTSVRRAYTS
jgi:phage anti-repressor protein